MKEVLFIYRGLQVGGIETFYCRLAESYDKSEYAFRFLLMSEREQCHPELLKRLESSAEVIFYSELVLGAFKNVVRKVPVPIKLLFPLDKTRVRTLLAKVESVHATEGLGILLGSQIFSDRRVLTTTVGFYHQKEFSWGDHDNLPYFERVNRKALGWLPDECLMFFNEGVAEKVCSQLGRTVSRVRLFPLGVDTHKSVKKSHFNGEKKVRIVSIGRLTNFKTYNLWMVDVVSSLSKEGWNVSYDVYGSGDIQADVQARIDQLRAPVRLLGTLEYSKFSETVLEYDLFVGSGTAIIEASALGVPSIIGIESVDQPVSYGYFSQIPGFSYNEAGLDLPLHSVKTLLSDFAQASPEEKLALKQKHLDKVSIFSMETCVEKFQRACGIEPDRFHKLNFISWCAYKISYCWNSALSKLSSTAYSEKYK